MREHSLSFLFMLSVLVCTCSQVFHAVCTVSDFSPLSPLLCENGMLHVEGGMQAAIPSWFRAGVPVGQENREAGALGISCL